MRYNTTSLLTLVCCLLFWGCSQKVAEQEASPTPEGQTEVVTKDSKNTAQSKFEALSQVFDLSAAQQDQINAIYAEYEDALNTLQGDDLRGVRQKINSYIRTEVLTPEQLEQIRNQRGDGG